MDEGGAVDTGVPVQARVEENTFNPSATLSQDLPSTDNAAVAAGSQESMIDTGMFGQTGDDLNQPNAFEAGADSAALGGDNMTPQAEDEVEKAEDVTNEPPVVRLAGDVFRITAPKEGGSVVLDASPSFDPEGAPLEFLWQLVNSSVPLTTSKLNAATLEIGVPNVDSDTILELRVFVSDGLVTSSRLVEIVAVGDPNSPPVAHAQTTPGAFEGGATVALDGTRSADPDGDSLSFEWVQVSGSKVLKIVGADQAKASVMAPPVSLRESFQFALWVTDSRGTRSQEPSVVSFTVLPPMTSSTFSALYYGKFQAPYRSCPFDGEEISWSCRELIPRGESCSGSCKIFHRMDRMPVTDFFVNSPTAGCSDPSQALESRYVDTFPATYSIKCLHFMESDPLRPKGVKVWIDFSTHSLSAAVPNSARYSSCSFSGDRYFGYGFCPNGTVKCFRVESCQLEQHVAADTSFEVILSQEDLQRSAEGSDFQAEMRQRLEMMK